MLYMELIERHISLDYIILSNGKEELTYRELDARVRELAEQMRELGVEAGMRVLIRNENTIGTVVEILACIYLHVCFIPFNETATEEQLRYMIEDSQASLLIDHKGSGYKQLKLKILDKSFAEEDELVYIIYTSGSTGTPKGVMASCKQVMFCVSAINERLHNGPKDRILCALPLSFDYGLYQLFLALWYGAKLVLLHNPMMQQIPAILKREQITAFPAMPAMLQMMLKTGLLQRVTLSELRYISSTGDDFPVELIRCIHNLFPHIFVFPMYGLTECKRVSIMPENRWDKIWEGSCGTPLMGTEVYLEHVTEDGIGELVVRGLNVMEGYWNDEGAEHAFFEDTEGRKCLRTGDYFRIDTEGFLYFCGRKKRILKTNGYRISCVELETYLKDHLKEMAEDVRIVGIPSEMVGDSIVVCIHSQKEIECLQEQLGKIVLGLPQYQRPHSLYCTKDAFPLNANGKIDDNGLRENIEVNELYSI
ncbi:MAG: acyl--CoA ligase [Lachnospiraceae bacterium]|nr:acyl--CoA ligase [Lachnospiraceae bacterium]